MIDVTDGADVEMRLCPLKLCFCHFRLFLFKFRGSLQSRAEAAL
jgi:hypothetical protein